MNKKIFKSIFFTGIAVAIVSVIIIMWGMYSYMTKEELGRLKTEAYIVAGGIESSASAAWTDRNSQDAGSDSHSNVTDYLSSLPYDNYRVTWISADGKVLFDSDADASEMENHLEREEVEEALKSGYGESVRYSKTIAHTELYAAVKIGGNQNSGGAAGNQNGVSESVTTVENIQHTIIRVSCAQRGIFLLLGDFAQPLCILLAVVVMISLILAKRLASKIAGPINEINPDRPEDYIGKDDYAEVSPLLLKMSSQQEQLAKDRAEIEETARIRQEFTANVSHELKSPLHLISGYAEIIENGMAKADDIKPFAGKIRKESVRLSELVDDIIELTELDSLQAAGADKTNLRTLAENVAESLEPAAAERGVKINIDAAGDCFAGGSPKHLHSIIYNILDNAIKYNREGGEVFINIRRAGDDSSGFRGSETISAESCGTATASARLQSNKAASTKPRGNGEAPSGFDGDEPASARLQSNEAASTKPRGNGEAPSGFDGDEPASVKLQGNKATSFKLGKNETASTDSNQELEVGLEKRNCESGNVSDLKKCESGGGSRESSPVVLEITDTGIGIPKEHLGRVFERFYREDKSRSKNIGGTGLGLSIVKHAARLCNAEVQIDSEPGKGTKVTVIFKGTSKNSIT